MAKTRTLNARLRRKRWERVRTGLIIAAMPFVMLLALLTMPIWGPLLARNMRRRDQRMLATSEATSCERCGRTLGAAAIARADVVEAEHMARFHEEHPGVMLRYVRVLRAVCSDCGASHAYDEAEHRFRLLPGERRLWR